MPPYTCLFFSVRDWTRFLFFIYIYFFPLWRADLKVSGFAVEFAGCVWTVAVSGKEKMRIQKKPDMCGGGLSWHLVIWLITNYRYKFLSCSLILQICVKANPWTKPINVAKTRLWRHIRCFWLHNSHLKLTPMTACSRPNLSPEFSL